MRVAHGHPSPGSRHAPHVPSHRHHRRSDTKLLTARNVLSLSLCSPANTVAFRGNRGRGPWPRRRRDATARREQATKHQQEKRSSSGRDGKASAAAGKKNPIDRDATPLVGPPGPTPACKSAAPFLLPSCVRLHDASCSPLLIRLPLACVFPHPFLSARCQQRREATQFSHGCRIGNYMRRRRRILHAIMHTRRRRRREHAGTSKPRVHRGGAQKTNLFGQALARMHYARFITIITGLMMMLLH
jgi:hypothetical protein